MFTSNTVFLQRLKCSLANCNSTVNCIRDTFEGTGRDGHSKGEGQSERQDDPGRVQTERQRQVQHPGHDDQRYGGFLGVVVDERTFLPPPQRRRSPPHQAINQCHQGEQSNTGVASVRMARRTTKPA